MTVMQQLIKARLFRLLSETSQNEAFTSQLKESYDDFALKLLTKLQLETNHPELYYSLGFVHLELAGVCERFSGGEEKKYPENRAQDDLFGRIRQTSIRMANYCTEQQSQYS